MFQYDWVISRQDSRNGCASRGRILRLGYLILTNILENGPCHFVNGASTPSLNPYSFNTYANMLYVDQPIGTGFSYGTDSVSSTVTAAPYVWTLLQAFYAQFPQYESRAFGVRILRLNPIVKAQVNGVRKVYISNWEVDLYRIVRWALRPGVCQLL